MQAMYVMIAVLCILAIAYRFYSRFIAAKVLALDDANITPAHRLNDGQNFHPTNKWVLFGHHFAAISGAGPLLGPVLAAQFGYLPGLLWILIGVVLAGAVQDFVILVLSVRRNGKSLAQIAQDELGRIPGGAATIGILFVLVIALAGLGKAVVKALGGEDVVFKTGTRFVGDDPRFGPQATLKAPEGNTYKIKKNTEIIFPPAKEGGEPGRMIVYKEFELLVKPKPRTEQMPSPNASSIELKADAQHKYDGWGLEVNDQVSAFRRIPGSRWGVFSIALTIPIALFTGWWMYFARKGKVLEASIIGGLLTLGAVWAGAYVAPGEALSGIGEWFDLTESGVAISLAIYGAVASILPVWILLCPRDYLSSFLKIGTVILLVLGVIVANPTLNAPAINGTYISGGPTVEGNIFPFLFITIMCGAVSGFHSLVSSGTTPKMLNKEKEARAIGYGAMLIEGLVGIVALIAAASMPQSHFYQMNTESSKLPKYAQKTQELIDADARANLPSMGDVEEKVGESLQGRTGGAVTLAVGIAEIFDGAIRNLTGNSDPPPSAPARPSIVPVAEPEENWVDGMIKYWYHFAIMFEALFILTTIDTGTRVGRFLLQETLGKFWPQFGKMNWWPGAIISTLVIVGGWFYFINISGASFGAIWAMFGIANQMLAVWALAVATVALVRAGKKKYMWVTFGPMCVVAITTTTAAVYKLIEFAGLTFSAPTAGARINSAISASLIGVILVCTVLILGGAFIKLGEAKRTVATK
jgi:carbon starvation protein